MFETILAKTMAHFRHSLARHSQARHFLSRYAPADSEQGFTLIEMSIVLVIIGLIIGGIVKGEEVVATARVKIQTSQMNAIKGAVFTFQDKFGYLPGDFTGNANLGLAATVDGNQDGYINAGGTSASSFLADSSNISTGTESPAAWLQLSQSGLLAGIQTGTSSLATATTATYPGKISNSYIWMANFTTTWGIIAEAARLQAGTGAPTAIFREQDAYTLDSKFDDGSPATGDILVTSNTITGCTTAISTTAPSTYSLGTTANASALTCGLDFILQ